MRFPHVELSEPELLNPIEAGYGPALRQALQQELAHLRQEPDGPDQIQRLLQTYRNRMFDQTSGPATRLTALGCADTLWVFRELRVRLMG